jgi:Zn-dependent M32 family carboxypeptidase
MSKRDLKKYLSSLDKEQIEEQFLELYDKFSEVKTYYDFVFNPKEEKLLGEAKAKISNEYFPIKTKRAKLRRSTAQKIIKHFLMLGVDPFAVADVMLFSLEAAQKYSARREMRYASFYKSMLNSFEQAVNYAIVNGIVAEFKPRIMDIFDEVKRQKWENRFDFERIMEQLELE